MSRWIRIALVAASVIVGSLPLVRAAIWEFDPAHSGASFGVRHLMISNVRGEFHGVGGKVEWDEKDAASLKVDVTIDVSTLDTREPKRDAHLKSPDFFDAAKYAAMTFKSKSATSVGPNKYRVVGDLTIHGVTKETTFDVETTPPIKDPWGNTRIGATGTTKIDRTQFGLNWNKPLETGGVLVGNEVAVTFDAELVKKEAAPVEKK